MVDLEIRGVPGVVVASAEFVDATESQARALGVDAARVFVPHPIQDRTDEEMRAMADAVADAVVEAVTAR